MFKQNTFVAKPTDVIPAVSKSLRKAQEGHERRVPDRTARPAQTNEQLRHEIKERRQTEELLLKEQRYLRYLLELQDRDRQMISYEIHDGLVQQLAAAMMQFEMFSRVTGHKAKAVWKTFETGVQMLSESMREARRLIKGLRSPAQVHTHHIKTACDLSNLRHYKMANSDLTLHREKLLALRASLLSDMTQMEDDTLKDHAKTISIPTDMGEIGTDNAEQELTFTLLGSDEGILGQIKAAIQRIENGSYGRCQDCGKQIPKSRLDAIPYAADCVQCASREEKDHEAIRK
jgi:RNA polymerase-binding protein DksA